MSQKLATTVGRKLFAGQAKTFEPHDPVYETYVDKRGRTKTRKRKIPEGLSKRDAKILKKIRRRAHYLDKGFSLCGFRFGWTAIIGLIPFVGDFADAILSYTLIIRTARKADLPAALIERMIFNTSVSIGLGLVPIVGDIMLAVWKANSRNANLLEDFLIARLAQTQNKSGTEGTILTNHQETAIAHEAILAAKEQGTSAKTGEPKVIDVTPEGQVRKRSMFGSSKKN